MDITVPRYSSGTKVSLVLAGGSISILQTPFELGLEDLHLKLQYDHRWKTMRRRFKGSSIEGILNIFGFKCPLKDVEFPPKEDLDLRIKYSNDAKHNLELLLKGMNLPELSNFVHEIGMGGLYFKEIDGSVSLRGKKLEKLSVKLTIGCDGEANILSFFKIKDLTLKILRQRKKQREPIGDKATKGTKKGHALNIEEKGDGAHAEGGADATPVVWEVVLIARFELTKDNTIDVEVDLKNMMLCNKNPLDELFREILAEILRSLESSLKGLIEDTKDFLSDMKDSAKAIKESIEGLCNETEALFAAVAVEMEKPNPLQWDVRGVANKVEAIMASIDNLFEELMKVLEKILPEVADEVRLAYADKMDAVKGAVKDAKTLLERCQRVVRDVVAEADQLKTVVAGSQERLEAAVAALRQGCSKEVADREFAKLEATWTHMLKDVEKTVTSVGQDIEQKLLHEFKAPAKEIQEGTSHLGKISADIGAMKLSAALAAAGRDVGDATSKKAKKILEDLDVAMGKQLKLVQDALQRVRDVPDLVNVATSGLDAARKKLESKSQSKADAIFAVLDTITEVKASKVAEAVKTLRKFAQNPIAAFQLDKLPGDIEGMSDGLNGMLKEIDVEVNHLSVDLRKGQLMFIGKIFKKVGGTGLDVVAALRYGKIDGKGQRKLSWTFGAVYQKDFKFADFNPEFELFDVLFFDLFALDIAYPHLYMGKINRGGNTDSSGMLSELGQRQKELNIGTHFFAVDDKSTSLDMEAYDPKSWLRPENCWDKADKIRDAMERVGRYEVLKLNRIPDNGDGLFMIFGMYIYFRDFCATHPVTWIWKFLGIADRAYAAVLVSTKTSNGAKANKKNVKLICPLFSNKKKSGQNCELDLGECKGFELKDLNVIITQDSLGAKATIGIKLPSAMSMKDEDWHPANLSGILTFETDRLKAGIVLEAAEGRAAWRTPFGLKCLDILKLGFFMSVVKGLSGVEFDIQMEIVASLFTASGNSIDVAFFLALGIKPVMPFVWPSAALYMNGLDIVTIMELFAPNVMDYKKMNWLRSALPRFEELFVWVATSSSEFNVGDWRDKLTMPADDHRRPQEILDDTLEEDEKPNVGAGSKKLGEGPKPKDTKLLDALYGACGPELKGPGFALGGHLLWGKMGSPFCLDIYVLGMLSLGELEFLLSLQVYVKAGHVLQITNREPPYDGPLKGELKISDQSPYFRFMIEGRISLWAILAVEMTMSIDMGGLLLDFEIHFLDVFFFKFFINIRFDGSGFALLAAIAKDGAMVAGALSDQQKKTFNMEATRFERYKDGKDRVEGGLLSGVAGALKALFEKAQQKIQEAKAALDRAKQKAGPFAFVLDIAKAVLSVLQGAMYLCGKICEGIQKMMQMIEKATLDVDHLIAGGSIEAGGKGDIIFKFKLKLCGKNLQGDLRIPFGSGGSKQGEGGNQKVCEDMANKLTAEYDKDRNGWGDNPSDFDNVTDPELKKQLQEIQREIEDFKNELKGAEGVSKTRESGPDPPQTPPPDLADSLKLLLPPEQDADLQEAKQKQERDLQEHHNPEKVEKQAKQDEDNRKKAEQDLQKRWKEEDEELDNRKKLPEELLQQWKDAQKSSSPASACGDQPPTSDPAATKKERDELKRKIEAEAHKAREHRKAEEEVQKREQEDREKKEKERLEKMAMELHKKAMDELPPPPPPPPFKHPAPLHKSPHLKHAKHMRQEQLLKMLLQVIHEPKNKEDMQTELHAKIEQTRKDAAKSESAWTLLSKTKDWIKKNLGLMEKQYNIDVAAAIDTWRDGKLERLERAARESAQQGQPISAGALGDAKLFVQSQWHELRGEFLGVSIVPAAAVRAQPKHKRMPCAKGCGLTAYKHYGTCCTRCDGGKVHAHDCFGKNTFVESPKPERAPEDAKPSSPPPTKASSTPEPSAAAPPPKPPGMVAHGADVAGKEDAISAVITKAKAEAEKKKERLEREAKAKEKAKKKEDEDDGKGGGVKKEDDKDATLPQPTSKTGQYFSAARALEAPVSAICATLLPQLTSQPHWRPLPLMSSIVVDPVLFESPSSLGGLGTELLMVMEVLRRCNISSEVVLSGDLHRLPPQIVKESWWWGEAAWEHAVNRAVGGEGPQGMHPGSSKCASFILCFTGQETVKKKPLPLKFDPAVNLQGAPVGFVVMGDSNAEAFLVSERHDKVGGLPQLLEKLMVQAKSLETEESIEWHSQWQDWSKCPGVNDADLQNFVEHAAEAADSAAKQEVGSAVFGASGGEDDDQYSEAAEFVEPCLLPADQFVELLTDRFTLPEKLCLIGGVEEAWQAAMMAAEEVVDTAAAELFAVPPNIFTQYSTSVQGKIFSIPGLIQWFITQGSTNAIWLQKNRGGKRTMCVSIVVDLTPSRGLSRGTLLRGLFGLIGFLERIQVKPFVVAFGLAGAWVVNCGEPWDPASKFRLLALLAAAEADRIGLNSTVGPSPLLEAVTLGVQQLTGARVAPGSPRLLWLLTEGVSGHSRAGMQGLNALAFRTSVEMCAWSMLGRSLDHLGFCSWIACPPSQIGAFVKQAFLIETAPAPSTPEKDSAKLALKVKWAPPLKKATLGGEAAEGMSGTPDVYLSRSLEYRSDAKDEGEKEAPKMDGKEAKERDAAELERLAERKGSLPVIYTPGDIRTPATFLLDMTKAALGMELPAGEHAAAGFQQGASWRLSHKVGKEFRGKCSWGHEFKKVVVAEGAVCYSCMGAPMPASALFCIACDVWLCSACQSSLTNGPRKSSVTSPPSVQHRSKFSGLYCGRDIGEMGYHDGVYQEHFRSNCSCSGKCGQYSGCMCPHCYRETFGGIDMEMSHVNLMKRFSGLPIFFHKVPGMPEAFASPQGFTIETWFRVQTQTIVERYEGNTLFSHREGKLGFEVVLLRQGSLRLRLHLGTGKGSGEYFQSNGEAVDSKSKLLQAIQAEDWTDLLHAAVSFRERKWLLFLEGKKVAEMDMPVGKELKTFQHLPLLIGQSAAYKENEVRCTIHSFCLTHAALTPKDFLRRPSA
eukprot:TRINITY_DN87130_c0_g1_i1.p1 TRINITY_DN87130_c0_g1~~TRINITY_DN87130_c0_g1_i1.p1  ORF type:complete len:3294 (+),score=817.78 TRINITY_DN87130_c0_g1_i1:877-9882(+)